MKDLKIISKVLKYKALTFALLLGVLHFVCVVLQQNKVLSISDGDLLNIINYSRVVGIYLLLRHFARLPYNDLESARQKENKFLKEIKQINKDE